MAHASKVYANNKKDAKGNILAIGHMNPPYINSFDQKSMEATFRLSNAAPQYQTSHGGPWKRYEELLAAYATEVCAKLLKGTLYVYTGTEINKYVKEPYERTQGTLKKPQVSLRQPDQPTQARGRGGSRGSNEPRPPPDPKYR